MGGAFAEGQDIFQIETAHKLSRKIYGSMFTER